MVNLPTTIFASHYRVRLSTSFPLSLHVGCTCVASIDACACSNPGRFRNNISATVPLGQNDVGGPGAARPLTERPQQREQA
jgi:hypothetical protein